MKNINVIFDDDEFETLEKMKGDKTWRIFILELTMKGGKNGKNNNK